MSLIIISVNQLLPRMSVRFTKGESLEVAKIIFQNKSISLMITASKLTAGDLRDIQDFDSQKSSTDNQIC